MSAAGGATLPLQLCRAVPFIGIGKMRVGTAAATYLAAMARPLVHAEPAGRERWAAFVEISDAARARLGQAGAGRSGVEVASVALSSIGAATPAAAGRPDPARRGAAGPDAVRPVPGSPAKTSDTHLGDELDRVFFRDAALVPRGESRAQGTGSERPADTPVVDDEAPEAAELGSTSKPGLSESEEAEAEQEQGVREQVGELRARDREVRTHEQAHKSAGGRYAGAIHYETQTGPDGKRYAVGGHVNIDVAPVDGDPEATLRKMEVVRKAALAPAEPSAADRQVAATASATAAAARAELAQERLDSAE